MRLLFIFKNGLIFPSFLICLLTVLSAPDLLAQKKGFLSKFSKKAAASPAASATDSTMSEEEEILAAGDYDTLKLSSDAIPDLMLDADKRKKKEKETKKKKKIKKNVFFGLKTRKNFTKTGNGDRQVIELFYTLAEYKDPNPYVRHVHWYDRQNRKITDAAIKDKQTVMILHGPYQKIAGGKVIEEGFYYVGAKHGRWEKYKGDNTLMDKVKYLRGFPKEADISYYDAEKKKIKEVIPKEYGVVKGEYYRYYDGGQLEVEGRYDNGIKVGRWMEYYQYRRQRKKETVYGKDAFDTDFQPYVVREWDENGNVLLDKDKGINRLAERGKEPVNTAKKGSKNQPPSRKTALNSKELANQKEKEADQQEQPEEATDPTSTPTESPAEEKTTPAITEKSEKQEAVPTPGTTEPAPSEPKKFDNKTRPGAPKRRF
jgi:antitoxin component YwqK of YwqJK toxin-antitoxin module